VKKVATISIISAKGGVGKTTVTANLGAMLSKEFGKKVLLIDANVTTPTLGLHMGVISQEKTLIDVLEDEIPAQQAIYIQPSGLHIMPASLSVKHLYGRIEKLKEKIDPIKESYDYVFIDCAAGIGKEVISAIKASDSAIIVTNPDIASVTAAVRAIKIAKLSDVHVIGIILNKVENKKYEMSVSEVEDLCETKVIGIVPFDRTILESTKAMTPSVLYKNSSSRRSFKKLAGYLVESSPDETIFEKLAIILRLPFPKH
jgi:septum site-determining protein MinD